MSITLTPTKPSASMRKRSIAAQMIPLRYIVRCLCIVTVVLWSVKNLSFASPANLHSDEMIELGRTLFNEPVLGRDGRIRCQSCHDPAHAYADANERSIGIDGQRGTRNAPSLVGVGDRSFLFWDGRRSRLETAVLDPLTNPVEMGWPSLSALTHELKKHPEIVHRFEIAFPGATVWVTEKQISDALASFLRTLTTGTSDFDRAQTKRSPLTSEAELGRQLFTGAAQCSQCHVLDDKNHSLTDDSFHHSSIGNVSQSEILPILVSAVVTTNLDGAGLGHRILTDPQWSSLGRFAVSHRPVDVGAFRTPSLRNVAATAPYMHDGSIATLSEAVDHEIYYRGFNSGRPINLSGAERSALVAFLETLTDAKYEVSKLSLYKSLPAINPARAATRQPSWTTN